MFKKTIGSMITIPTLPSDKQVKASLMAGFIGLGLCAGTTALADDGSGDWSENSVDAPVDPSDAVEEIDVDFSMGERVRTDAPSTKKGGEKTSRRDRQKVNKASMQVDVAFSDAGDPDWDEPAEEWVEPGFEEPAEYEDPVEDWEDEPKFQEDPMFDEDPDEADLEEPDEDLESDAGWEDPDLGLDDPLMDGFID